MMGGSSDNGQFLPFDLSQYPKLSREQAGHLRHFYNLSSATDGDWPHMGSQEPAQEFLDAYRYQLATMAYASSLTHYHRMPALRGLFKSLIRCLIHKMLRREVWGYWYLTSQSGVTLDPDLKELRKPWANPVVRENIMYSGHLLLMTSLYEMLFDDDEFTQPGSLTFHWNPLFWGMGPETFEYDNRGLQRAIIDEMERNGWVGVCCEPNTVFVACNQFPVRRWTDACSDTCGFADQTRLLRCTSMMRVTEPMWPQRYWASTRSRWSRREWFRGMTCTKTGSASSRTSVLPPGV